MRRLKSAIPLLNLCSRCDSGVIPFSLYVGDFALLRCELGTPACVVLVCTGQAQLGNTHCPTLGITASISNKPKPYAILVNDRGPGPRIRG